MPQSEERNSMIASSCIRLTACLAAGTFSLAIAQPQASAQERRVEDPWFFTLEGTVGGPLNDPPRDQFNIGGVGSLGVYHSFLRELSLGLRLGAGALTSQGPVVQDPIDRGALELGMLSASARFRPFGSLQRDRRNSGLWLEIGAGPWLVEDSVNPVFDAAIAYGIDIGPIVISPLVRFTHVLETHGRYGNHDILIASGGLEISFNDQVRMAEPEQGEVVVSRRTVTPVRPAPVAVAPPPPAAEPLPPEEDVAQPFVNDQLVIDERVFFDYGGWDLRPAGIEQLEEVARRYRESGGRWEALVISGHADRRGPPDYNMDLSRKRAQTVRDFLTSRGVPNDILEIQAWGEERPEIRDASTEAEHQVNRRVQFEITWRDGERPEGVAPASHPTQPDYVDEAPANRRDEP
jgi:outer membrane protein OmpA-like peptidoglycan-associated protein